MLAIFRVGCQAGVCTATRQAVVCGGRDDKGGKTLLVNGVSK